MNLKGRSFLTLLDFNKDEIRYMLDLAHELKAKKRRVFRVKNLKVRISCLSLINLLQEHVALLKLRQWMRVHM